MFGGYAILLTIAAMVCFWIGASAPDAVRGSSQYGNRFMSIWGALFLVLAAVMAFVALAFGVVNRRPNLPRTQMKNARQPEQLIEVENRFISSNQTDEDLRIFEESVAASTSIPCAKRNEITWTQSKWKWRILFLWIFVGASFILIVLVNFFWLFRFLGFTH